MAPKTAVKLLILITILFCIYMSLRTAAKMMLSVEFEVYGRVQGVYFRKYTKDKATDLGLKGWCMNTRDGTVTGIIQGESDNISEMKEWLTKFGSPSSVIDKCNFANEKQISKFDFNDFSVRH